MIEPLEKLVEALCRLPTIGRKSALRLALHLLEQPQDELDNLSQRIATVKSRIKICRQCFNYGEADLCDICSSPRRDRSLICVVEKPADVLVFEKSGIYRGLYHVLGGVLSPINGITADKLRIAELRARLDKEEIKELILGLGASAEAETTCLYCARIFANRPFKISLLARGVPAGTELEYIDQLTLNQALHERNEISYGDKKVDDDAINANKRGIP
jgi:recombination protein RecR